MNITRLKIETLIVKIAQTREIEASCDDCARLSAKLVEALLAGEVQDAELETILHHLEECIPCAEEFHALQDYERMDRENSWPPLEQLWQGLQRAA